MEPPIQALGVNPFPEELSRADREKSRWKQRNDSSIVLRQTAGSKRIHGIQVHYKTKWFYL